MGKHKKKKLGASSGDEGERGQKPEVDELQRRKTSDSEIINKNKRNKKKLKIKAETNFSLFDYGMILFFLILVGGLGYLKYNEGLYARSAHAQKMRTGGEDHYQILGVEPNAKLSQIKANYRKLTRIWHPDKNPGCKECTEKFEKIVKAYELLIDENKRINYDDKQGFSTALRSASLTLTSQNYERLVIDGNDYWIIQVFEPDSEICERVAPIWENTYEEMKHLVKFGRINMKASPELLTQIPFKIQFVPTIFSYVPGRDSEILSIRSLYDPNEMRKFCENIMMSVIENIGYDNVNEFLKIPRKTALKVRKLEKNEIVEPNKFSVLLLSKEDSKVYKKIALKYSEIIDFGKTKRTYKTTMLRKLDLDPMTNIIITHNSLTSDRELSRKTHALTLRKEELEGTIDIIIRNTIIDIYKNNYHNLCGEVEVDSEPETEKKDTAAKICVIVLENWETKENSNYLKQIDTLQRYASQHFEKEITKKTSPKFVLQMGRMNLDFHPELKKFLYEQQNTFKFDKSMIQYLGIIHENQCFSIFTAQNTRELHDNIEEFSDQESQMTRDYFGNYKTTIDFYLSRARDTVLIQIWRIIQETFTFTAIVVSFVFGMIFKKIVKIHLLLLMIFGIALQMLIYIIYFFFSNFDHYFS